MKKLFFCCCAVALLYQCQPVKTVEKAESIAEKFPEEWVGEWEGTLNLYNAKGKFMEVYTGLHILPLGEGRYSWTIIYGEGEKRDERKYEIYAQDSAKGHFRTDEKNTIVLDDFLIGNTLYSRFEVMGNLLLTAYRKDGEKITFEVVSGKIAPIETTGGQDSIPAVNSYGISTMQRAVLHRKKGSKLKTKS